MKRTVVLRGLTVVALIALLVALPLLGGCRKDADATAGKRAAEDTGEADAEDPGSGTGDGEAADNAEDTAAAPDGSGSGSTTPSTVTVKLYWVEAGENALAVERTLPYTEAVATAAINALLTGPTPQEQTTWPAISTNIPAGTRLLGLTVANGIAKIDLSKEFESGGGTFSVTSRLAQVVYTLAQFPTVDAVEFYIEGEPVEMFSGEGLILDGPQTLDDYDDLVPIDA
ncbi:MAG: hypothetical protein EG823_02165 [Actinobacteria bacterium]|nr:hypothetical protein [Actinomycetota bacterium]